jgi:serine/threonine protein kinase
LSGIRYLHNEANPAVVHRDVKSPNILVTKDWMMKLCDFGSAKRKDLPQETLAGTAAYAAPEMLRQDEELMVSSLALSSVHSSHASRLPSSRSWC